MGSLPWICYDYDTWCQIAKSKWNHPSERGPYTYGETGLGDFGGMRQNCTEETTVVTSGSTDPCKSVS
ncbi:hypothetical protein Mapa_010200 [Marchantia paleacea]|nr:hypothetical protein Mapa_010200 [Marchantia paleacea]